MARRTVTSALVGLFVGLLVTMDAPAVSASRACAGYAQEHCEAMMAAQDAAQFSAQPVHILAGNGIGQEQFEALEGNGSGLFVIAVPTNTIAAHVESGYAPENYAQMASVIPSN